MWPFEKFVRAVRCRSCEDNKGLTLRRGAGRSGEDGDGSRCCNNNIGLNPAPLLSSSSSSHFPVPPQWWGANILAAPLHPPVALLYPASQHKKCKYFPQNTSQPVFPAHIPICGCTIPSQSLIPFSRGENSLNS